MEKKKNEQTKRNNTHNDGWSRSIVEVSAAQNYVNRILVICLFDGVVQRPKKETKRERINKPTKKERCFICMWFSFDLKCLIFFFCLPVCSALLRYCSLYAPSPLIVRCNMCNRHCVDVMLLCLTASERTFMNEKLGVNCMSECWLMRWIDNVWNEMHWIAS